MINSCLVSAFAALSIKKPHYTHTKTIIDRVKLSVDNLGMKGKTGNGNSARGMCAHIAYFSFLKSG